MPWLVRTSLPSCDVNVLMRLIVAERLKREGRHEIFEQETMEELEDEEGNVYNRKTYDDLKKQGLI
jgi:splicing factor 3A subunit 3